MRTITRFVVPFAALLFAACAAHDPADAVGSNAGAIVDPTSSGYAWKVVQLQLFAGPAMGTEIPLDDQGDNLDGVWTDTGYYLRLEVENAGSATWHAAPPMQVRLATTQPDASLYYVAQDQNHPDGWPANDRPAALAHDVAPTEHYVFKIPIHTPPAEGTYPQTFVPVLEPSGLFKDLGAKINLTIVDNPNKDFTAPGWATNCDYVGTLPFDPIRRPGMPSAPMDFFGSKGVASNTTYASLRAYSDTHDRPSTCLLTKKDSSVAYVSRIHLSADHGGAVVPGAGVFAFFEPLNNIDASFYPYRSMPNGLRILADATTTKVKWGCSGNGNPAWDAPRDCRQYDDPAAHKISHVSARVELPTCWDGLDNDGDLDGYHAHVAYKVDENGQHVCPSPNDQLVPGLILTFNWSSETEDQQRGDWFDPNDVQSIVFGYINGFYQGGPGQQDDLDLLTTSCLDSNGYQGCACGAVVNAFDRIHDGRCVAPQASTP